MLFGEQTHNCSETFLFSKLTYKSLSNASATCIHPPFFIWARLATIVSPVNAIFCRKMLKKSACLWRPLTTRTRSERDEYGHFGEFSKPVGLMGFSLDEFFQLKKCLCFSNFVSTQPQPYSFFCFFGIKSERVTVTKLAPILDGTWTRHFSHGCLFVVNSPWIFLKERLDTTNFFIITFIA